MMFNHFKILSCTVALVACMAVVPAHAGKHAVSDATANATNQGILAQDTLALVQKLLSVIEAMKLNASMGEMGKQFGGLDGVMSNIESKVASFPVPAVPKGLEDLSFESAMGKADSMKNLIQSDLLPTSTGTNVLTDYEKKARALMRESVYTSALSDGYSNAVTYATETAKASAEELAPLKDAIASTETVQEAAQVQNAVRMAGVSAYQRGNQLTAELLKMQAAQGLAYLPEEIKS